MSVCGREFYHDHNTRTFPENIGWRRNGPAAILPEARRLPLRDDAEVIASEFETVLTMMRKRSSKGRAISW